MAAISPLAAIRYPQAKQSDRVAPPYDLLSAQDKARLLQGNPENIAAVDLPHVPPKDAGPDDVYEQAGHTFRSWLDSGVLRPDSKPGFYPYQQTYTHGGTTYQRRGFFTRVRLEEFAAPEQGGTIHPHEQTFSGPKADRLKLMEATRANLSPVFGLYDDPKNDVTDLLFEALRVQGGGGAMPVPLVSAILAAGGFDRLGPPGAGAEADATVLHELWAVTDPAVIRDTQLLMADKHIYIADGHHRYTTALNYRRQVSELRGVPLAHGDPANFALFVLVAMQDPGLIILPTHRVVAAAGLETYYAERFEQIAKKQFQIIVTKLNGDSLRQFERELAGFGPHAIGVYDPVPDRTVVLKPRTNDPLAAIKDDPALAEKSPAWRQLDVAILQHLVFERLLALNFLAPGRQMAWAFPHEAAEVAALCRSGQYRVGFLLQPTPLTAVCDLCNAGELMPQKSTFFYPKLATGLVINPLE